MTYKFCVMDTCIDGEWGGLAGVDNLKLVETEEEAILECQKRLDVRVYHRDRKTSPFTASAYPVEGVEISVEEYAEYCSIGEDGTIHLSFLDKLSLGQDYHQPRWDYFVEHMKPIYELDPRGSAYNHKIIGYEMLDTTEKDTI